MASPEACKAEIAFLVACGLPGRPASDEAVAAMVCAWEVLLGDVSDQDLHTAVVDCARRAKFWPAPAEILDAVPETRSRETRLLAIDGAYETMLRAYAVSACASMTAPPFRGRVVIDTGNDEVDVAMAQAIDDCGGSIAVGEHGNQGWFRARWIGAFQARLGQSEERIEGATTRRISAAGRRPGQLWERAQARRLADRGA